MQDSDLVNEVQEIMNGELEDYVIIQDGILVMKGRICVPNVDYVRRVILE